MIPEHIYGCLGAILLDYDDHADESHKIYVRDVWDWMREQEYSQPTAPEPDWSQAPEWAEWHSIDAIEIGSWWEFEPQLDGEMWDRYRSRCQSYMTTLPLGIDWRTTLRERPK